MVDGWMQILQMNKSVQYRFIRAFNCLHMQPYGYDGFQPAPRRMINLISMTKTTELGPHAIHPSERSTNKSEKYKFRDLFAFVNGTEDKTNYKIFVNGPSSPGVCNAYCMLLPAENSSFAWAVSLFFVAIAIASDSG